MNDRDVNETQDRQAGSDIFSLLHAAHALEDRVEATLGGVGLSMPEARGPDRAGGAREAAVAWASWLTRLSCVKSNVTQLVDRLEADGLVRRVADPDDRRVSEGGDDEAWARAKQAAGAAEIDALEGAVLAARSGSRTASAVERVMTALKSSSFVAPVVHI